MPPPSLASRGRKRKPWVLASYILLLALAILVTWVSVSFSAPSNSLDTAASTLTNLYHQQTSNSQQVSSIQQQPVQPISVLNSTPQLLSSNADGEPLESIESLRRRMPPSVWTQAGKNSVPAIVQAVKSQLTESERQRSYTLCGKFLYSSLRRAIQVGDMGEQTFVATGDIDDMWTRDSAVQMGIYVGRMGREPWLRLIVQGAIRRQAFNIIQDPYANAYERKWVNPSTLSLRDRVIGRGGWVATRNYELDSGAYFLTQIYDYYVADDLYRPEDLLEEPLIFDAVMLMVDTWIVEQYHDDKSPYRYFELPNQGKGSATAYTGMTWTGFRPSDDACQYGYLIPANIHAAAGLERTLELNKRIWKSASLETKARKLLSDIEEGIRKHGVIKTDKGELIYAYEVDGKGNVLTDFDDANVPSLLSIPVLGWSGYDREVYRNTRKRLLSPDTNRWYFAGNTLRGIGSPHTPHSYVWPMAFAIEALTTEGSDKEITESMVFQIRQSLTSACHDAMHEGVHSGSGCAGGFSRNWFEWANALFVVLVESSMGERCDAWGRAELLAQAAADANKGGSTNFYQNRYNNDHRQPGYYLGVESLIQHYE